MLPVSSWPPGPPGASLSPFSKPRCINVSRCPNGYVLPKGAWVVQTGANRVVMFRPSLASDWWQNNPARTPGTGILPGQRVSRETCTRPTHDQALEAWRAWQRKTGNTNPPIRPLPGRVPPNFFGWKPVNAPSTTLVPPGSGGTVLADGQNVVITGSGFANITQAYSV